jgi:hypothetical protein
MKFPLEDCVKGPFKGASWQRYLPSESDLAEKHSTEFAVY